PPDAMARRAADIVRRVEALPGVTAATASNMVPYLGGGSGAQATAEGSTLPKDQDPRVQFFGVTPHVIRTLNIALLSGRDFTDAEGATKSPVAIVNRVFAGRLWPKIDDVIG